MAKDFGFNYLVRPNRGEHKKAGNLRYGYANSTGEHVLILDADFIPHKDIIHEALPYMDNPKIAIVQTPQFFFELPDKKTKNAIQFGSSAVVEEFYKILLVSRDKYKAGACVGTSAIYRRTAIVEGGGPPIKNRSEDAWERILTLSVGYDLKYIPLILSAGINPENVEQYFKQHNRWSTGSVEIAFSPEFWGAKMKPIQRLLFLQNPLYYFSEVLGLFSSLQLYILWVFFPHLLNYRYTVFFIPHIIMYYFVQPSTQIYNNWWKVSITSVTQTFTYLISYFTLLQGRLMEWLPTNQKSQYLNRYYLSSVTANGVYLFVVMALFGIGIVANTEYFFTSISIYVIMFWIVLNLIQISMNFMYNLRYIFTAQSSFVKNNVMPVYNYNRWRLKMAGGGALVLCLLAITVGGLGNFADIYNSNQFSGQIAGVSDSYATVYTDTEGINLNESQTTSLNQQNITIEAGTQNQIINESPIPTKYSYVVQNGESMSLLTRRSISDYSIETNTTYTPEQRIFAETNIVTTKGAYPLTIGEEFVIEREIIEYYLELSRAITSQELALWSRYARSAGM